MSRTVYLHVGVAKTGTTYLQRVLFGHRAQLRTGGLLYPGQRSGDQYAAAVDLRGLEGSKFEHLHTQDAWKKLATETRAFGGNAVISHETLARCTKGQARRAVSSFGKADVKVVLTVRDLGRQIPAVWQETLKNRASDSYGAFLEDVFVNTDSGEHKFFWRPQDVGRVVRRWSKVVGPDNVVIVTVPPSGAPHDELWRRFAAAIAMPDVEIDLPTGGGNVSLGPAEAELLRYINRSLPKDLPFARYARVIKRQLAEGKLARRTSTRIVVPPGWHEAVRDHAEKMLGELARSGATIVGDLDDLRPVLSDPGTPGPDEASREELMTVAAEVILDYALSTRTSRSRPPRGRRRSRLPGGALRGRTLGTRASAALRRLVRRSP